MLRNPQPGWWRRFFATPEVPAYVPIRSAEERRCPECSAAYDARDRYCPSCHTAVPEWRFG